MKNFLNKMLLVAAVLLSGVFSVQAQNLKIGYTEPNLIINLMPEYKLVLQKLDAEYQGSDAEIRLKAQEFQTKLEDYQRRQGFMSDSTKAQTERELVGLQEEVQNMQQNKSQALQQKEAELMEPLFERLTNAINQVAKEKGLDFVFATKVSSNGAVLLYAKEESYDITGDILTKLGIQLPKTPATPDRAQSYNRIWCTAMS